MIGILNSTRGTMVRIAGICITLVGACITRNALQQDYGILAGFGVVIVGTMSTALIATQLDSAEEMHNDEIELVGDIV